MNQFKSAIIKGFKNSNNFKSRASRPEYWYLLLSLNIFVVLFTRISPDSGLGTIVYLVYIVPLTAAAVRRMHDTGHSGWWILFPIVNLVFLCTQSDASLNSYGPPPPPLA